MIITVDGPAAAGKGTLSQSLARKYGLAYFDTGMVYRAVGVLMLRSGKDLSDVRYAEKLAEELTFAKMMKVSLDKEFRSAKGGKAASVISSYSGVRHRLLDMQKNFALKPTFANGQAALGVIYDGRDTGTVICPKADVKFFITATSEVRAQRRFFEFKERGIDTDFETVLRDIKVRDERDANRKDAPMKPAEDAHILDTSNLSIDEVFKKAVTIIEEMVK